jgi:hypothetical protein
MSRATRYLVRDAEGRELEVPSLPTLAALHSAGFLADDDLVRQARSDRWVRAGDMHALGARRERGRERRWLWSALGGAVLLVAAVAMILAGRGAAGP